MLKSKGKVVNHIIFVFLTVFILQMIMPAEFARAYGIQNENSAKIFSDTEQEKADMTVMLYCVGSDLEGRDMAATCDICEIMEGISISKTEGSDVKFIVETGGTDTGLQGRDRAGVIENCRQYLETIYKDKKDIYTQRYDYLTKGDNNGFTGISWINNERFEICANELVTAKNPPSQPGRIMTRADGNNSVPELAEFIRTTMEAYPARNYMLLLWNHGGGPSAGLGIDERGAEEDTFKAWNIAPTMDDAGFPEDEKFVYVNYDACLMGSLENALAWEPFAYYYCGSEDLEPNNGEFYENWVSYLYKEAHNDANDFSNKEYVLSMIENLGRKNVDDYYEWYTEKNDNGTKSLICLSEMQDLANALSDYGKALSELIFTDSMEGYYGIYDQRNVAQDFGGRNLGVMDLRDFVFNMKENFEKIINSDALNNTQFNAAIVKLKEASDKLMKAEEKAVVSHKETFAYDLYNMGGLTVFLPYLTSPDKVSEYIEGYDLIRSTDSIRNYRSFIGTFNSIQSAGKLVSDADKKSEDIAAALEGSLRNYGLEEVYNTSLKKLPEEIYEHRLQNEGMKIYINEEDNKYYYTRRDFDLVYNITQSPCVEINGTQHFLGYLPAGAYKEEGDSWSQELTNYGEKQWFGFKDEKGSYIPVSVMWIDTDYEDAEQKIPGNPFNARSILQIPILYEGRLSVLDVVFENGSKEGKIYGMWPYDLDSRTFGRYVELSSFKGKEITLLADVANVLEGEEGVTYDSNNPQGSILGSVVVNDDTRLYRGLELCGEGNNNKSDSTGLMYMRYFMRDLYGSLYHFEDLNETVSASLESAGGMKARGSALNSEDLKIRVTGQKGDVYEDSEFKDLSYYYYDDEGERCDLVEIDGKFYTKDKNPEGGNKENTGNSEDLTEDSLPDSGYKEFILEKETTIYADQGSITIDNMTKIDGATEDLDKYFSLQTGELKVTLNVADTPKENSDQFTNKSKENAKQAMVCDIEPVTYTGRNLLTTQSVKNGDKVIDLVLYSEDGKSVLKEGTDYTVSYSNNKNAADMTQKKNVPTLTINGKGDYKGMKYIAIFTIKKADMKDVTLTFNKRVIPLSGKGITPAAVTATLPGGAKIPNSQLKFYYYGQNGEEISQEEFIKAYKEGYELIPFTVKAEALSKAKNIVTGSMTGSFPSNDVIYARPKSKGSLKVTLNSNKADLKEDMSGYELFKSLFKSAKIGKTEYGLEDIQFYGVYNDRVLVDHVNNNLIEKAGTYYLAFALRRDKQKESGFCDIKIVRVKVK